MGSYAVPVGMPVLTGVEDEVVEVICFEVVEVGEAEDDTGFPQVPGAENPALQEVQ